MILRLSARTRDRTMLARGECASTGVIHCGVECDGGGVDLEPQKDGTLLVRLKRKDGDSIRMSLGCGGDEDEASVLRPPS
jgi:hypothetical protein